MEQRRSSKASQKGKSLRDNVEGYYRPVMVFFTVAWMNLKVFQRGGRKQHKHVYSLFLYICC